MANTVNINQTYWDGQLGAVHRVVTSDGTAESDTSVLDISSLGAPTPSAIRIRWIDVILNGNFELVLEFDASTDQEWERFENQAVDQSFPFVRDYTQMPNGGKPANNKSAAGFTGDIISTTTGLANGDGYNLLIIFETDD